MNDIFDPELDAHLDRVAAEYDLCDGSCLRGEVLATLGLFAAVGLLLAAVAFLVVVTS